ncbi:NACHT, LRR and PYD domains-containing protein 12-like isoform X2 [Electrophorus electricus]|uniref:NACHT, LRR and PYD domains-containing protein 12-like isoform X2 n=1 Tax=Electrophorus electricus TaxID=8005 RepID=UPI0015CFB47A|nr:NACHT, LRR and PYD domains-containing protein 12-like isoform X2 [Electrophorus electricus]
MLGKITRMNLSQECDECFSASMKGFCPVEQEGSDPLLPRCETMVSERSMEHPAEFKDGGPSSEHSLIQKKRSESPVSSNVSMKSAYDCTNDQRWSRDLPSLIRFEYPSSEDRHSLEPPADEFKYFKLNLIRKFQYFNEIITNQGNPEHLNEVYTELYITEGRSGEMNNEHEMRQTEATSRRALIEDSLIKCNNIFKPISEQHKPIRTVLTKGVAGIGKSVSVQKFILDWAEGKANQNIQIIFPLPFRELNLLKDQNLSLMDLLHFCVNEPKELDLLTSHKVLFICDGLDECYFPLDFQSCVSLCDVTQSSSVNVLMTNLIKGNLLPTALIWITSRPAAADQIPSEIVDRVTEVRGFSDPQKEEYFRKRISDQILANRIITHMKSSRSLYIMCHIPVFCWIAAIVLERMWMCADSGEFPKTLTQMYTHFLIIQTNTARKKYIMNQKEDNEMILKLGRLAFQQLMKGNLVFYEEDLRECDIDVTEALVYSGVCTQIFREEFRLHQRNMYCFVHLSIQEHLAAVYVHLMFINNNTNVLKQSWLPKRLMKKESTVTDLHKSAVDHAIRSKNEHLDIFLRFLLGLSLDSNQTLLQGLITQTGSSSFSKKETIQYIKKKIRDNLSPEKSISLFHSLNELEDHSLVEEIQHYLQCDNLNQRKLSSSQWSAVVFVLLTSEQSLDVFDLQKYRRSDEVLLKLKPVVAASRSAQLASCHLTKKSCAGLSLVLGSESSCLRELDLSGNKLGDSGVKLLSAGLENPQCKLKTLWLKYCDVTDEGCATLASALTSNPSHLIKLDLSGNKLRNSGVLKLFAGLEKSQCTLEILRLCDCDVTDKGCAALTSALTSNSSHLRELNLMGNNLGDSGVKWLSAGLQKPHCKLETLWLKHCDVTHEGCAALASALKLNPSHLRKLNLTENLVGDSGIKQLSLGLENPHCKLESLWLKHCDITDKGCAALVSALGLNLSHLRMLDLSRNKLGDSGVKLLSDMLKDTRCKIKSLGLCDCDVTDEGCAALASALTSNPSHLRELNFYWNKLGDSGKKQLHALKDDPLCMLQVLRI